jgi:hypothetical protein
MTKAEQDAVLALRTNEFIAANRTASRTVICREVGATRQRLIRLHGLGTLVNYPRALTTTEAGKIARKNKKWANFKLKGSPIFDGV